MVGKTRRGTRRNAEREIVLKHAVWLPARHWRMGFRAQTYPVTREKIVTPMRPWGRMRKMGSWRRRGRSPSPELGRKRSGSKARAIWVATTRRDAIPRRPYCLILLEMIGWLIGWFIDGLMNWLSDMMWCDRSIAKISIQGTNIITLTSTHFTFSVLFDMIVTLTIIWR